MVVNLFLRSKDETVLYTWKDTSSKFLTIEVTLVEILLIEINLSNKKKWLKIVLVTRRKLQTAHHMLQLNKNTSMQANI